jgi:RNA polymerase sigma-70 factor (ECF subfamily)
MDTTIPKHPPKGLIERSLVGDQRAFEQIFHDYKNLVYKTACLMLNNAQEAEDILQVVFLQVYRSLDAYDPAKGAFTTWLHRITINRCLNWERKQRFNLLSLTPGLEGKVSKSLSPEDRLGDKEELRQAIHKLSDKLRAAVILRYDWEMSYAEIAETLDIPLGTVKSRLAQALEKLGKELSSPALSEQKETAK